MTEKALYIESLLGKEDDLVANARKSAPEHLSHMQLPPCDLKLICILLRLMSAKNVLEIGTFVGTSAIGIASSLQESGTVHTIEKSPDFFKIAEQNIRYANQIKDLGIVQYCGDASDVIKNFSEDVIFDAIFIDAAKSEYVEYLNLSLNKLRVGGLIIADNTLLFDMVYGNQPEDAKGKQMWTAMREFNLLLSDSKKFESMLIPTRSGLTIAIKSGRREFKVLSDRLCK